MINKNNNTARIEMTFNKNKLLIWETGGGGNSIIITDKYGKRKDSIYQSNEKNGKHALLHLNKNDIVISISALKNIKKLQIYQFTGVFNEWFKTIYEEDIIEKDSNKLTLPNYIMYLYKPLTFAIAKSNNNNCTKSYYINDFKIYQNKKRDQNEH